MADDVASGIMQAAEGTERGEVAASCQVIAMTAHGHSDRQLWSLGSTTERLLQAARKPLLIVH